MRLTLILGFFIFMAIVIFFIEFRFKKIVISKPVKKESFNYIKQFYFNNDFTIKDGCLYGSSENTYFKIDKICINSEFIVLSFVDFIQYDDFFRSKIGTEKTTTLRVFKNWISLSS